MPGEKPSHKLCVIRDATETGKRERFHTVGAGWANSKGQVRFVLNPGVTLRWDDGLSLWVFENKDERRGKEQPDDRLQTS
jgi:hypothetical protein